MRLFLLAAALLLAATGCGSGDGTDATARDAAPTGSGSVGMPTAVPAADGTVRTTDLATVMDKGRAELCVGPVAESWPPQCGGPEIVNWDWDAHGQGMFDHEGDVRWGTFLVTGRWDGESFEVVGAIPGPLFDPAIPEPPAQPRPSATYSSDELEEIAREVGALPGAQGAYAEDGHVFVDVLFDDGTLQAWADGVHGTNVVLVRSLLVPAD